MFRTRSVVAKLSLCAVFAAATGAGPLDPPAGPIAPTMRTLTEVSPRIPVNVVNTPGDADSIYRIAASGSYVLTGNVTGAPGKHTIKIVAENVRLDLNGFMINVSGGESGVLGTVTGIEVRNGSIRGAMGAGVELMGSLTGASVVEDVFVRGCQGGGIRVFYSSVVRNCRVLNVGGTGISAGANAQILNCSVDTTEAVGISINGTGLILGSTVRSAQGTHAFRIGSGIIRDCTAMQSSSAIGFGAESAATLVGCTSQHSTTGFLVGTGSNVESCQAIGSFGNGFSGGQRSIFKSCVATQGSASGFVLSAGAKMESCSSTANDHRGIHAEDKCTIRECTVEANGQQGIRAGSFCIISGNQARDNGASSDAAGIWISGSSCRVEDNEITGNDFGLWIDGTDNFVVRNTARGNAGTAFHVGASPNEVAPVINNPGTNGFAGATPWSNFAY